MFDGATGEQEGSLQLTVQGGELVQVNKVIPEVAADHGGGVKRFTVSVSGDLFRKAFRVDATGDPITIDALSE